MIPTVFNVPLLKENIIAINSITQVVDIRRSKVQTTCLQKVIFKLQSYKC